MVPPGEWRRGRRRRSPRGRTPRVGGAGRDRPPASCAHGLRARLARGRRLQDDLLGALAVERAGEVVAAERAGRIVRADGPGDPRAADHGEQQLSPLVVEDGLGAVPQQDGRLASLLLPEPQQQPRGVVVRQGPELGRVDLLEREHPAADPEALPHDVDRERS